MNFGLILVIMKTMKKYKTYNSDIVSDYAIIGTGDIALRHANNIYNLKKNKVVTICKRSKSKFNQNFSGFYNNFTNNIIEQLGAKKIFSANPLNYKKNRFLINRLPIYNCIRSEDKFKKFIF